MRKASPQGVPESLQADVTKIFHAALRGVDPFRLVSRVVRPVDGCLIVGSGARAVRMHPDRLFVVGVGKASAAMAAAVSARFPDACGAIIKPPGGPVHATGRIVQYEGNHPVPGPESFQATQALLERIEETPPETEILFLLSGGASALFAQPGDGITHAQKAEFTDRMLRAGAPIGLFNRARLRLSGIKGGRFLQRVAPRRVTTLTLSDVPGGADWEIGSGPTCFPPEAVWREDLCPRLEALLGDGPLPGPIEPRMAPREAPEAPMGQAVEATRFMVGDNTRARRAAARAARMLGYQPHISRYRLAGEASRAAREVLARLAAQPASVSCVVFGGETTVSLGRAMGVGGRSQELALAAVSGLAGTGWVLLAAGTDGVDGVGGAAGGVVGPGTLAFLGLPGVEAGLADHDSATVLGRAGALLMTGPTGTNVGDLVIAIRAV